MSYQHVPQEAYPPPGYSHPYPPPPPPGYGQNYPPPPPGQPGPYPPPGYQGYFNEGYPSPPPPPPPYHYHHHHQSQDDTSCFSFMRGCPQLQGHVFDLGRSMLLFCAGGVLFLGYVQVSLHFSGLRSVVVDGW